MVRDNVEMYEWLEQELAAVKTPRFHIVDGPADSRLREAVMQSSIQMPSSYKEFVLRFGNARLYRRSRNDSYIIGVFAGPRMQTLNDGTQLYQVGFHDSACVSVELGLAGCPVFEFEAGLEEKAADDFDEWLEASCAAARDQYNEEQWAGILRGPEPFTQEENEIIETRRLFHWRVLGIDEDKNHIFEIGNASCRRLPALTVGVRSKDGRLNGAIRLRTEDIGPGQTTILHVGCYKGLKSAEEIEIFALPDPQPEDREYFSELQR